MASHDAAFRRQAANRKSLDWAVIDPTIYNEAFTGRAKSLPRCRYCLAETHDSKDCQYAPGDEPPPSNFPRAAWGHPAAERDRTLGKAVELCDLFNRPDGNRCTFRWCRYAHMCAKCKRGPHPASECSKDASLPGPSRRSGTAPPPTRQEEARSAPPAARR